MENEGGVGRSGNHHQKKRRVELLVEFTVCRNIVVPCIIFVNWCGLEGMQLETYKQEAVGYLLPLFDPICVRVYHKNCLPIFQVVIYCIFFTISRNASWLSFLFVFSFCCGEGKESTIIRNKFFLLLHIKIII